MSNDRSTMDSSTRVKWFEQTSDEPYDRHHYQLVLKTGQVFEYDDYTAVMGAWFQTCKMGNLDRVVVIDKPEPKSKGFK